MSSVARMRARTAYLKSVKPDTEPLDPGWAAAWEEYAKGIGSWQAGDQINFMSGWRAAIRWVNSEQKPDQKEKHHEQHHRQCPERQFAATRGY